MAGKYAPRPDEVRIGPHTFSIEWLTTDEWDAQHHQAGSDGLTYISTQEIKILLVTGRSESYYQMILLHEVLHAVWGTVGMTLDENWATGEAGDIEERVALLTSPTLLGALKDNRALTAYLLSDGKAVR